MTRVLQSPQRDSSINRAGRWPVIDEDGCLLPLTRILVHYHLYPSLSIITIYCPAPQVVCVVGLHKQQKRAQNTVKCGHYHKKFNRKLLIVSMAPTINVMDLYRGYFCCFCLFFLNKLLYILRWNSIRARFRSCTYCVTVNSTICDHDCKHNLSHMHLF